MACIYFYQDKSSNNKRLRDNYDIKKSSLCLLKEYVVCKKEMWCFFDNVKRLKVNIVIYDYCFTYAAAITMRISVF